MKALLPECEMTACWADGNWRAIIHTQDDAAPRWESWLCKDHLNYYVQQVPPHHWVATETYSTITGELLRCGSFGIWVEDDAYGNSLKTTG